jgi:deoxyribonuclease-4
MAAPMPAEAPVTTAILPLSDAMHALSSGRMVVAAGPRPLHSGLMFGSHLSVAGSMSNALREAESLKLDTVQVFTKNQQQWRVRPLEASAVSEWKGEVKRLGWEGRTTAHASYLINLASPNDELWEKSIGLMRVEIERCEELAIPLLIHHPGSPTGAGVEFGLARVAAAYGRLLMETRGFRTVSCLENTVGAGSTLGGPFEELARLRAMIVERTGVPERVGFCIDTCHAHAFGYDLSTRAGAEAALDELDRTCGLAHVRALHLNDSRGPAGSHLDRHAHIGEGTIGGSTSPKRLLNSGFAAVVCRPEFRGIPKILETPKGQNASGTQFDTLNLRRLSKLTRPEQPINNRRPGGRLSRRRPVNT